MPGRGLLRRGTVRGSGRTLQREPRGMQRPELRRVRCARPTMLSRSEPRERDLELRNQSTRFGGLVGWPSVQRSEHRLRGRRDRRRNVRAVWCGGRALLRGGAGEAAARHVRSARPRLWHGRNVHSELWSPGPAVLRGHPLCRRKRVHVLSGSRDAGMRCGKCVRRGRRHVHDVRPRRVALLCGGGVRRRHLRLGQLFSPHEAMRVQNRALAARHAFEASALARSGYGSQGFK
jgi:hypothetical protein